jgi:WD40 repeat protein
VFVWDALTARRVATLRHHHEAVRDVSWHPTEPEITTASWDGGLNGGGALVGCV